MSRGLDLASHLIEVGPGGSVVLHGLYSARPVPNAELERRQELADVSATWAALVQPLGNDPMLASAVAVAVSGDLGAARETLIRAGRGVRPAAWATSSRRGRDCPNQDRWFASGRVFAVADGVGGSDDGARAASVALQTLACHPIESSTGAHAAAVRAHRAVRHELTNSSAATTMATTLCLAAVLIESGELILANCGDSRAYLFRGGGLRCLTVLDDTQPAVPLLESSIGGGPDDPRITVTNHQIRAGDRLLLCTDGVFGSLDRRTITALVAVQAIDVAAERLCDAARSRGSQDDTTAVTVELTQ